MPIKGYDKHFGGKSGSASKALEAMTEEYGEDKAKKIFYSMIAKKRKQGNIAANPKQPHVGVA